MGFCLVFAVFRSPRSPAGGCALSPNLFTINGFAELTGVDRRTVKKRLERVDPRDHEGEIAYYLAADALPFIYQVASKSEQEDESGNLIPPIETSEARKAAADAEMFEMKRDKMKDLLLDLPTAERTWENIVLGVRQKILGLPTKLESQFVEGMKTKDLRTILDTEVDEILTDLSKPVTYDNLQDKDSDESGEQLSSDSGEA